MTPLFVFFAYAAIAFLTFWKLLNTFFQQDEWAIFGNYLYWEKAHLSWWARLFIYEQDTHIVPFSNFLSYAQFAFFGLNFIPYAIVAVILHVLNAFLVYKLAVVLVNNKKIGFLSGLFFLVNSITHQTVTWVATTTGTAGSTFFILLSVIFFIEFLKKQEKIRNLLLSCFFLLISLLFKETSLFSFFFFPFLWFMYGRKKSVLTGIKVFIPFFILGFIYVCFRAYFFLFGYRSSSAPEELSQPDFMVYLYRLFTSPLKFITQSFISLGNIITFAGIIVVLGYPHFVRSGVADPYVVETVASDIISYFLAFLIIGGCILLINKKRLKELGFGRLFLTCFVFIALSSLPFLVIPGKAGYFSLLDGRHLYLTSVFGSILLSGIIIGIYSVFKRERIALVLLIVFIIGYLGMHGYKIRSDLNKQMAYAYVRQLVLNTIYHFYPKLPPRVIFYIESDTAYYGLPDEEKILPFQSGFGQTLLVWYNDHGENIPSCFFQGKYLYVLLSQNYKECGGRGFGYYRNINLLKKSLVANNLSAKNVIAFRYNSFTNSIIDITKEVQNALQ